MKIDVSANSGLDLRVGEWVEVRSREDILATLDENGCFEGLPFMPEMLQYAGQRLEVRKSAHKTCDTINNYRTRGMANAVHLEGARCDGQAHGGCQARCMLFWKDAWLKHVSPPAEVPGSATKPGMLPVSHPLEIPANAERLVRYASEPVAEENGRTVRYRCQATDLLKATTRLDWHDPKHYWQDLKSGNIALRTLIVYVGLAALRAVIRRLRRDPSYPYVEGLAQGPTRQVTLNLKPGERVRVRSRHEIYQTINKRRRTRGLSYDVEMEPFSGREFEVLARVEKIVDEKTGKMLNLTSDCIILDKVVCGGCLSRNRLFCPREIYPYWREAWLERITPQPTCAAE